MTILNLGAGVQSTVLYLMGVRGELAFDCAIFSDLGDEPAPVYAHMNWLRSLGGPTIHTVDAGRLGDHLIHGINGNGGRVASIPAWTAVREGEPTGKILRQCTAEYKIKPIERFVRRTLFGLDPGQRFPAGTKIVQLFGISMDEAHRAWRIQGNAAAWQSPRFPLIENRMTRRDCVRWLEQYPVHHAVPRSACVFCPYKSDREWQWLRENDPKGFERAIEIDEKLRSEGSAANQKLKEQLYLHKRAIPLREAKLTDAERGQSEFSYECQGGCGL